MYFGYGIVTTKSIHINDLNEMNKDGKLCLIDEKDLGMICAEVQQEEAATQEIMRRYTATLCHVIKSATIIPLRFGTLFENEEEIRQVIKKNMKAYTQLLTKLDNKIEIELKVWWKKETFQETMLKNKKLAKWKKQLEKGTNQGFDIVEFGKGIMEVADQERLVLEKAFLSVLSPLAVDVLSKEPTDEFQAFDGVFLVTRQNEQTFDNAVGALYEKNSEIFRFKYTGPWAPHHFI